jgi:hypothetical protein
MSDSLEARAQSRNDEPHVQFNHGYVKERMRWVVVSNSLVCLAEAGRFFPVALFSIAPTQQVSFQYFTGCP